MMRVFDAFWRAVAYCLRPGVMLVSLLPLLLVSAIAVAMGYFFWDAALEQVRVWLEDFGLTARVWAWLDAIGLGRLKLFLVPLIVIFTVTPVLIVLSLLVVAMFMTPGLVRLVSRRRFSQLDKFQGGSFLGSLFWTLGSTLAALLAMLVTVPLWPIPPLMLVLPPMIWGWLAFRVMAYDALAEHATVEERQTIFEQHRFALMFMGISVGYLGAAPSLIWASGAMMAVAFPVFVPFAIWMYTMVFAFSSLWFVHYCLAALKDLRGDPSIPESGLLSVGDEVTSILPQIGHEKD